MYVSSGIIFRCDSISRSYHVFMSHELMDFLEVESPSIQLELMDFLEVESTSIHIELMDFLELKKFINSI